MKKLLFTSLCFLFSGCIFYGIISPKINYPVSNSSTAAVIVCIEDSYVGYNTGALKDLQMMSEVCSNVTDKVVILKNGRATRKNVKEAIKWACSHELAIVYFTCHGGQQKAYKDKDELDGKDEVIYLADQAIVDNELWECFSTSTNRVFTIFDCCNSGTMFKATSNPNYVEQQEFILKATNQEKIKFSLLSFSACNDGYVSFASNDGGLMTKSLYNIIKTFDYDISYQQAWTILKYSSDASKKQKACQTIVGDYKDFNCQILK